MDEPQRKWRKPMRAKSWNYNRDSAYFVTIVTHHRAHLFGAVTDGVVQLTPAGHEIDRYWRELESKYHQIQLDEYVIMPNHLHGIVRILPHTALELNPSSLGDMMKWFKSLTTNAYIQRVKNHAWPKFDGKLWQSGYWDHIVRNDLDLERIREYIANNPWVWTQDPDNPDSGESWNKRL